MVTFKDCNLQDLCRNEVLQLIGITLSYMQLLQNKDVCSHSWIYIFLVCMCEIHTHIDPHVLAHIYDKLYPCINSFHLISQFKLSKTTSNRFLQS